MKKWVKEIINTDRRRFLKVLAIGGGVLAIGKTYNFLTENKIISEVTLKNYKITETGKEIRFSDKTGEDILVIDKDEI